MKRSGRGLAVLPKDIKHEHEKGITFVKILPRAVNAFSSFSTSSVWRALALVIDEFKTKGELPHSSPGISVDLVLYPNILAGYESLDAALKSSREFINKYIKEAGLSDKLQVAIKDELIWIYRGERRKGRPYKAKPENKPPENKSTVAA